MGRSARDRRPQQPRPVQRIQLPEGDTTKRLIAVVVLIVGIYDAFPLAERTLIYKNGHLLTQQGNG